MRTTSDEEYKNLEKLLDRALSPGSEVFVSHWVGEQNLNTIATHENAESVIMSRTDYKFAKRYEDVFDNLKAVDSVGKHLSHREVYDAEFLALPGRGSSELRQAEDLNSSIDELVSQSARFSDSHLGDRALAFYSSNVWDDARMSPLDSKVTLEEVELTKAALEPYFDSVKLASGKDYRGVIGYREP